MFKKLINKEIDKRRAEDILEELNYNPNLTFKYEDGDWEPEVTAKTRASNCEGLKLPCGFDLSYLTIWTESLASYAYENGYKDAKKKFEKKSKKKK